MEKTLAIYLCPQYDHTYSACVAFDTSLPFADAVELVNEQEYPVDVYYTRTDLNGSSILEADKCENLHDLLATLDWCGQCRYMINRVWDFDRDKTESKELIELLNDAWFRRAEISREEMDWAFEDIDENLAKVYAVSPGGMKFEIFCGTSEQCTQFCEDSNWTFWDDNEFGWSLELDDTCLETEQDRAGLDDLIHAAQAKSASSGVQKEPEQQFMTLRGFLNQFDFDYEVYENDHRLETAHRQRLIDDGELEAANLHEPLIGLVDLQGANLGDIESNRFPLNDLLVQNIIDRMDIYVNDSVISEFDDALNDRGFDPSILSFDKEVQLCRQLGVGAGEVSYVMAEAILHPEKIYVPELSTQHSNQQQVPEIAEPER